MKPKPAILIVERDSDTRDLYEMAFSPLGACTAVKTIEEAFQQLQRTSANLLIIDEVLPREDVCELRAAAEDAPVIVVTAYCKGSLLTSARVAGYFHAFLKPVNINELIALVDGVLSRPLPTDSQWS